MEILLGACLCKLAWESESEQNMGSTHPAAAIQSPFPHIGAAFLHSWRFFHYQVTKS